MQTRQSQQRRPKVLCLGVSYPDLTHVLASRAKGPRPRRPWTVPAVVHAVQHGTLTQMDGRDLARVLATEQTCQVDIYTISQEQACRYRTDRHLSANFNRANHVVAQLQEAFGDTIWFDEVILDYFWIPKGWDVHHWTKSFFAQTLLRLAHQGLVRGPSPACEVANRNTQVGSTVYLPFTLHCLSEILANQKALLSHYNVSFVRRHNIDMSLWRGTQHISPRTMQHVLGKRRDQENIYCGFGPSDLAAAMERSDVKKVELTALLRQLEDFADIQFLALRPLENSRAPQERRGSFVGLVPCHTVQRGFDSVPTSLLIRTPRKRRHRPAVPHTVTPATSENTPRSRHHQRTTVAAIRPAFIKQITPVTARKLPCRSCSGNISCRKALFPPAAADDSLVPATAETSSIGSEESSFGAPSMADDDAPDESLAANTRRTRRRLH